jgi:fimbrial chaperone protein
MRGMFRAVAAAAAALALAVSTSAEAYQVSPMIAYIKRDGNGSSYRLIIKNTEATPITLELTGMQLGIDDYGKMSNTPDDKRLMIFPPQIVVPAGRSQTVMVRYLESDKTADQRVLGVLISQLPVDMQVGGGEKGVGTAIKIGFNFLTFVVVGDSPTKPEVKVAEAARTPTGDLRMTLDNGSGSVAFLRSAKFVLSDARGKSVSLTGDKVQTGDTGVLPPRRKRIATIPANLFADLDGTPRVTVQLES